VTASDLTNNAASPADATQKKQGPTLQAPGPRLDIPTLTQQSVIGLILTFILAAAAWGYTFVEMWHRWFPAWQYENMSFGQRLTEGDSYYTHGPLVPIVSIVIAWLTYKRVGAPAKRTLLSNIVGWTMFVGSVLLHFASSYAQVTFVSGFALVSALTALLIVWGGWPLLKAYALPVILLLFMVPIPMDWIAKINFQLKFFAAGQALWLTNYVFGVPANLDGSMVHLVPGADGVPKRLVVENVCGGLRSLIALIYFASLFAMISRSRGFWRVGLLLMAVPVAIATNIIRITSLNLVAHYYTVADAGPGAWFHDLSGLAVFVIALGIMFALDQLIVSSGKLLKRDWSDSRLMGFLDNLPRADSQPAVMLRWPVLVMLVAAAAWSIHWAMQDVESNISSAAAGAVPKEVSIDGRTLFSQDLTLDDKTLAILQTNDYLYRRFFDTASRMPVDLLIVFSPNNRKGTHPPEVCLEGSGEEVISKRLQTINVAGVGAMTMRELITSRDQRQTYHLYVYKSGDSYTASYLQQQFTIFWNGLRSRNASGALIRVTVPIEGEGVDAARALTDAVTEVLMAEIDQRLP
jgi:EpsI family protein